MGIWQEIVSSVFIAFVLAFLVAKLIALLVSFKDDNSVLARDRVPTPPPAAYEILEGEQILSPPHPEEANIRQFVAGEDMPPPVYLENEEFREPYKKSEEIVEDKDDQKNAKVDAEEEGKEEGFMKGIEVEEEKCGGAESLGASLLSDEDEWERVESSEVDVIFGSAAAYVASMATNVSQKVPNEVQLLLSGLYKVATEGPCTVAEPSALKIGARAKWNAWQSLGNMTPEAAMEQYIGVLNEILPSWNESLLEKKRKACDNSQQYPSSGGMTSVHSSFMHQEEPDDEVKLETAHSMPVKGTMEACFNC